MNMQLNWKVAIGKLQIKITGVWKTRTLIHKKSPGFRQGLEVIIISVTSYTAIFCRWIPLLQHFFHTHKQTYHR
jgi:hypothetical protein